MLKKSRVLPANQLSKQTESIRILLESGAGVRHVEMAEYDSDKEYPGNSQRYSPHFDFCKDDSKRYG